MGKARAEKVEFLKRVPRIALSMDDSVSVTFRDRCDCKDASFFGVNLQVYGKTPAQNFILVSGFLNHAAGRRFGLRRLRDLMPTAGKGS